MQGDPDLTVPDLDQRPGILPGEEGPSFLKPVSSITQARGSMVSVASLASWRRTGSTAQAEAAVNCCSCWWSILRRSDIGWIELRFPSSINPADRARPWRAGPCAAKT